MILVLIIITLVTLLRGVAELADAHDLGSCLLRGEGSSPFFPNNITKAHLIASFVFMKVDIFLTEV